MYQNETVWLVAGINAVISIVVCTVALALLVAMSLHSYFTYRLVSYQILSLMLLDFAYSLLILQFVPRDSIVRGVCQAIGFLVVYAVWVNLLFSVCAVIHLYCFAVAFRNLRRFEPVYVAVCVLLPLLYAWIPLSTNSYGSDNYLCFVTTWNDSLQMSKRIDGIVEEFVLFYGPLVGVAGMNCLVVLTMFAILARRVLTSRRSKSRIAGDSEYGDVALGTDATLDYKMEVVRQLCPLMFSTIFILGMILFPFGTRIYDAATASQPAYQFELDLTIGLVAGFSGTFLGSFLILHLCYVRAKKVGNKIVVPSVSDAALGTRRGTSLNDTVYNVPPESEVDRLLRSGRN